MGMSQKGPGKSAYELLTRRGYLIRHSTIPLQGQLVTVRRRRYVVVDVVQGIRFDSSSLPGSACESAQRQHVVRLSSVEDDALGEELQVIWELEPGVKIVAKNDLPNPLNGFDVPEQLDTFLQAIRWATASNAESDTLQAPFRSGVTLEDYQLDPVVRAIKMPRVNLLIADDVGLGKTIEAGLVCQELIIRHRVRTVLVLCPASLQVQWRDQMRTKFGLEFRIVDSQLMSRLRRQQGIHVNPWTYFPRIISSLEFFRRDRPLQLFCENLPRGGESVYPRTFDLLIIDEAHNIAPAGRGHYAIDSLTTRAIREIAPHFEHKLFLSATPHSGYRESFTTLLELLDNQRFARTVDYRPEQLDTVMIRRLKTEMKDWDDKPRFPVRQQEYIPVNYTEQERNAHHQLQTYTKSRLSHIYTDSTERLANDFVLKLLKKRLFSSPEAFAQTLKRHRYTLEHEERHTVNMYKLSVSLLSQKIEEIEKEPESDTMLEESVHDAIDVMASLFYAPTPEEIRLLDQMQAWAEEARKRADSKATELIQWLKKNIKPDKDWSNKRVIIFTEYLATQNWLKDRLASYGLVEEHGKKRTMMLYGGMDVDEQEEIKAAFQADPAISPVRILLATDAASEGIDLQNQCSHLIHYELPWNPNRLEQRNGRIDRHGQRSPKVYIYHFVSDKFMHGLPDAPLQLGQLDDDLEYVMRILKKVDIIRQDLGKVGSVIADEVEEVMLGKKREVDFRDIEARALMAQRETKIERDIKKSCRELYEELNEARRTLNMTPHHIRKVVETALQLDGELPLIPRILPGINSSPPIEAFDLPPLQGSSWRNSIEGLPHPFTGIRRPIVFDHDMASGRDDVVLAHLNHPLVDISLHLLRAAIWSPQGKLHRVTARVVPNIELSTPVVVAHARLMILGGQSQRLHEELVFAGGELREGRFEHISSLSKVERLLNAATSQPVGPAFQRHLVELWPEHKDPLFNALRTRMNERRKELDIRLKQNEEREITDITTILQELEQSILLKLSGQQTVQPHISLDPFDPEERRQYQRDQEALRERLEEISDEIEKEVIAIRKLYANPQTHLFPVAVTYLVPARLSY
jgi:SNF2 family DNA or RNA helicase